MPAVSGASRARKTKTASKHSPLLVVSVGCPSGIGPEVSVRAAAELSIPKVLVGDERMLREAAELCGIAQKRLQPFNPDATHPDVIYLHAAGPKLSARDRVPGKPNRTAGAAQLAYINAAYELTKAQPRRALVTGPVSKAAIAHSGAPDSAHFLGHTEWLRDLDRSKVSVMCFAADKLVTSLVTTHLPIAKVPGALNKNNVAEATYYLAQLLIALGRKRPELAVTSLNPHAGESELLGGEEKRAIAPGIALAQKQLGKTAKIIGPIGAETAYRKAYAGKYGGVVAMYHDQATIPMKLIAFGDAVNVTMGLSIVRTSVDHGTAYDIAWSGKAEHEGMAAALSLAARMLLGTR
jgi:4-hydroxythreonine-4-phosphate dehydrogenase